MKDHDVLRLGYVLCLLALSATTVLSKCRLPKRPFLNGDIIYQDPEDVNRTNVPEMYLLRFACNPGYSLDGVEAILCISDRWTEKIPRCITMQCSNPLSIENGQYVLHTGVNKVPTIESKAMYTCDNGYELDTNTDSILTCTLFEHINTAQWKGILARCKQKETCPDPGIPPDGLRTEAGNTFFLGDIVTFSCNQEFEMVGEASIVCFPGGRWSSPRPLCRPTGDYCDHPPSIPHGHVIEDKQGDYFLPSDNVEIKCDPGFRYKGETEYIYCEDEIGWEAEFGECIEAFCDPPEPLLNGNIPELEALNITELANISFPYKFELTYICDKGYRLVGGDSWRSCEAKGWSRKTPQCEVIRCPDPGIPEHGTRIGNDFNIGQKVIFKCFTGYELLGSFERYCMPNGQWDGTLARCDDPNNYCPNPGIPVNGMKNSSSYNMGDAIRFGCQPGLTLLGSQYRECLPSRTWSGEEVTCVGPNDFDNTAKISNILKATIAEKVEEQEKELKLFQQTLQRAGPIVGRVLHMNFTGRYIFYFAFDVSGSVTEPNFRKSIAFAKAIVKRMTISEDGARAGALTFSSKVDVQFLPLDYKTTEDVLDALERIKYTGGGTAANNALASIRRDQIPLVQRHIPKKGQKSVIFILTDGKANMGGDPQDEAELLKRAGAEIYCVGITNSPLKDSLYKIASKKENVFILQNYASMEYLIQEITSGKVDYSQCGLGQEVIGGRGRIAGGGKASEPWPWMAALYFKSGSTHSMQCGGSIIHKYFILTAAHCLYNDDFSTRKKESEIIVKLGITDIKNETNKQEFEVERVFFHENYRTGIIFDYDIALLKLKSPIEFNQLVRPICLPPAELSPNSTFYKTGQMGVATGWGYTGILKKGRNSVIKSIDHLKEVILPIQSAERCNQSTIDNIDHVLRHKVFTNRMFCVGDGNGGNDTCKGDSGGPLMQSQLNKNGYTYWTQTGIVSWGIGCGLPNTYGYYTHVQKLLPWINDTIQREKDKENED